MIKNIVLTCLLFISFLCNSQENEKISIIDYKELKNTIAAKNVQLIDLRTNKENKVGFIGNAIQMDFLQTEKFTQQIKLLKKNMPVYIYCYSGGRSARAAKLLIKKGFIKVYDFSGGYKKWKKRNK